MKVFFSTVDLKDHSINQIIINTAYDHAAGNGKLELRCRDDFFNTAILLKSMSLSVILLVLKGLWLAVFKPEKMALLSFDSICIGRYAVATSYRSYNAYISRISFIVGYIKTLAKCGLYANAIKPMIPSIEAAYIDHAFYQNGVFYDLFARHGIAVYQNEYPYGLVRRNLGASETWEDALQVSNIKLSKQQLLMGKRKLLKITKNTNKIPYMLTKFDELRSIAKYDYIIYSHSFTDAQCSYGFDGGFNNIKDWLDFTLQQLKNSKVCVKAHPAIYTEGYTSQVVEWDRRLFTELVEKYKGSPNIDFINYPVKNIDLLNNVDKSTILISHHSNALLEGAILGFKCIAAKKGNWANFSLFNDWTSREGYAELLNQSRDDVEPVDEEELHKYCYALYYGEGSYFSPNWWVKTVADLTGFSVKDIVKDPRCINSVEPKVLEGCIRRVSDELVTL